ncbi:MAG: tRNA (adenosine(37)-N6)-dimethylallyltransferase MiaA [Jatrophihabitans sp.]
MADPKLRVLAVVGPTATGKSDLAVALAQRLDGEIVNADSMQLYEGMDIGTAKLPPDERGGIVHHLLDVWPLTKSAAVAEYQTRARAAIDEICARGRLPIVVGGSGLYLRGALDKLDFPGESPALRAGLYAALEDQGAEALHTRLAAKDPLAAAMILPSNGRRIVRALEVIELTGQPFTARMPGFESIYDCVQLGLERPDLAERVDLRMHRMMAAGLLDEIRGLLPLGLRASPTAGKALGYQQVLDVLDDDGAVVGDLGEAVQITIRGTRRFVKRQRTWFRRDPRVHWLDAASGELLDQALRTLAV